MATVAEKDTTTAACLNADAIKVAIVAAKKLPQPPLRTR